MKKRNITIYTQYTVLTLGKYVTPTSAGLYKEPSPINRYIQIWKKFGQKLTVCFANKLLGFRSATLAHHDNSYKEKTKHHTTQHCSHHDQDSCLLLHAFLLSLHLVILMLEIHGVGVGGGSEARNTLVVLRTNAVLTGEEYVLGTIVEAGVESDDL